MRPPNGRSLEFFGASVHQVHQQLVRVLHLVCMKQSIIVPILLELQFLNLKDGNNNGLFYANQRRSLTSCWCT